MAQMVTLLSKAASTDRRGCCCSLFQGLLEERADGYLSPHNVRSSKYQLTTEMNRRGTGFLTGKSESLVYWQDSGPTS